MKPTGTKCHDSGKHAHHDQLALYKFSECICPHAPLLSESTRVHTTLYTCCRDGIYKGNATARKTTQTRKRAVSRKQGSDSYCLASITATENVEGGKIVATYIATHTSHQLTLMECRHLPLPQSVTAQVRSMLTSGVQMEKVINGNLVFSGHVSMYKL